MTDTDRPMTDGPLVHKLRAEDATSVTLVTVPPFGGAVFPEVWHVPTRVYNAVLAATPAPLDVLVAAKAVLPENATGRAVPYDALRRALPATPAPLDVLVAAVDEAITYSVWTEAGDRAGDGFFIGKKWMERIFAALDNAQESAAAYAEEAGG